MNVHQCIAPVLADRIGQMKKPAVDVGVLVGMVLYGKAGVESIPTTGTALLRT